MSTHIPFHLTPAQIAVGTPILVVLLLLGWRRASGRPRSHPPGPRPLPLIGNLLDMPQSKFSLTWTKFGKEYGPLTWLSIPGQNILVINSFEVAKELLEKRPMIYIDRPRFTMTRELLGFGDYLSLSQYNATWKRGRSHLKHALSAAVVRSDYYPLFEVKARQYLQRCADHPENCVNEVVRTVGEAIIQLTYGVLEDRRGRDYIQIATRLLELIVISAQGYVVDLLPALQYLPKWLPGMRFKRDAARWREEVTSLENSVLELARENLLSEDPLVRSSFMFKKMQELHNKYEEGQNAEHRREDETILGYSGLMIFLGALETTDSTMQSFIRAMTLFPPIQKKAQAEIDSVIGSSRLPTFNDQSSLPYLHAVMLETLRWNTVLPNGLPHVSRRDDVYNGYFIPKGTTLIPNVWGFSRDSKYYPNPSTFNPERYLKQPPELDPRKYVFGYGRRICPGRDLAFEEVWIMVASVLWAFDIVRGEGEPVPQADVDRFTFGFVNRPKPFKCRFVPRRDDLKNRLEAVRV